MKKTLLIDSRPGGDFSLDLIWAGLVRRLGPENVVDFPAHPKHRMGKPTLTGHDEKDYGAERSSLGYTDRNREIPAYQESAVFSMLKNGEIERIFMDEREESLELYHRLRAFFFKVPVVVIAGHDRFQHPDGPDGVKLYLGNNLERMFIDDWQPEYDRLHYTSLTNLSINFDHLWTRPEKVEKKYDICFMGYNSQGERARVLDHIVERWGNLNNHIVLEKRPDTFDRFRRHQEYFEKMAESKICINVPGASTGGRALRYYEIPYVGSYMLSQTFPAKLLEPLRNHEHCDYFSSLGELDMLIASALKLDDRREQVARAGHEHAMRYHTVDARMDYIYGVIGG